MQRFSLWLIAGLLISCAASADWIDGFDGPLSAYTLLRQNQSLPIRFFQPLFAGDQLTVTGDYHLYLYGTDNQQLTVSTQQSPYTVQQTDERFQNLPDLWVWLSQQLNDWYQQEQQMLKLRLALPDVIAPEISALHITLPEYPIPARQQIAAGKRHLRFQWMGGKAPYVVRLFHEQQLLVEIRTDEPHCQTEALNLTRGAHRLEVFSVDEQRAVHTFNVINAQPFYPSALTELALPAETEQLFRAIWLAGAEGGRWAPEAWQQAMQLDEAHPAVPLLRRALEQSVLITMPPNH